MEQLSKQWIVQDAQYAEDSAGQRFKIKDFWSDNRGSMTPRSRGLQKADLHSDAVVYP